jgi:hypothetical protein
VFIKNKGALLPGLPMKQTIDPKMSPLDWIKGYIYFFFFLTMTSSLASLSSLFFNLAISSGKNSPSFTMWA